MDLLYDIKIALLPELIMILGILSIIFINFAIKKQDVIFNISVGYVVLALISMFLIDFSAEYEIFYGSFISNYFSLLFRTIILIGTLLTLFLSKSYIKSLNKNVGEFYFLILMASLGAMFLSGANDLIMIFIALEMLSLSSYALCGYAKLNKFNNEASLKYFVFGAAASAIMLYGFSFIYGITGETNLDYIAILLTNYEINAVLLLAFLFIIAGFGFKISAVPFHSWVPDIYQGAPLPVVAYLSVVSKISGFAVFINFAINMPLQTGVFSFILGTIAAITMTVGNLTALNQQNIKRLLGYSSIAHAGYILLGLAILTNDGITAVTYYLMTYLFMNFGVWAAVILFITKTGKENIDDFNGIACKNRYYALGLTFCLLSLAGIPITAGFFSKFYLFKAVILAGYEFIPLLVIALINVVIAFFYYMKIIKAMYTKPEQNNIALEFLKSSFLEKTVMTLGVIGVFALGIFAAPFIEISTIIGF